MNTIERGVIVMRIVLLVAAVVFMAVGPLLSAEETEEQDDTLQRLIYHIERLEATASTPTRWGAVPPPS